MWSIHNLMKTVPCKGCRITFVAGSYIIRCKVLQVHHVLDPGEIITRANFKLFIPEAETRADAVKVYTNMKRTGLGFYFFQIQPMSVTGFPKPLK